MRRTSCSGHRRSRVSWGRRWSGGSPGTGTSVRVFDNFSTGDKSHLADVDAELVEGDIRDVRGLDAALEGMPRPSYTWPPSGSVVIIRRGPGGEFRRQCPRHVPRAGRRPASGRAAHGAGPRPGGALIGDATPPVDERSLPKPISPYGASKLAGEGYAHAYAKAYGMDTVALRFANVYGPWSERKRGAMTMFFRAIHAGEPIVIYGDGSASRDYTHVDDIARALGARPRQRCPRRHRPAHRLRRRDDRAGTGRPVPRRRSAHQTIRSSTGPGGPVRWIRNFASYDLAEKVLRVCAQHSAAGTASAGPGSGSPIRSSAPSSRRGPRSSARALPDACCEGFCLLSYILSMQLGDEGR